MDAPPLIPPTFRRFLAAGLVFSVFAALVAAYLEAVLPNRWLHNLAANGELTVATLRVCGIVMLTLAALWEAVYLCCRPSLHSRSLEQARHAAENAQAEAARVEQAQKLRERVQMGGHPSGDIGPRPDTARAIGESSESWRGRIEDARKAHAQRVKEVEDMVLSAFARFAFKSDFFGAVPQQELFQTFGANLNNIGIPEVNLLRQSTNPTIRQLVAYAPMLRGGLMEHQRIKPYKKPYDPPPHSPLTGPFVKR